jgi:hypothetical protein
MPVMAKINGETFRAASATARLVELSERDLYKAMLEVVSEVEVLREMSTYVAEEGGTIRLSPDTKDLIAKATSALVDLNAGDFAS